MIGHIKSQCHKSKREQNHVTKSLPKKPSGPKHIVCHHCGAFGHLRPHRSKFQSLKRIKRKEKLELLGSCTKKGKPDLSENSMLLKKVFNALNSFSMCIYFRVFCHGIAKGRDCKVKFNQLYVGFIPCQIFL